jgi:hypothetical protein
MGIIRKLLQMEYLRGFDLARTLQMYRTVEPEPRRTNMQNPLEKSLPQTSVVGACTVTDCKFNENHECHAGSIEVRVSSNGAECGTYTPERNTRPRP